ncbi:nitrogen assimilation transcription factor nira [Colletotrichum karsti]|uniref:Nitrogen assimilation transcription factor nira n=1 Tax=Colletotrichum karsti TaxID=1095194 RepID=A0A9P6IF14_9PEZI|nr:nitrogen assimilation transcription factor nira [Colletotrichum karsti]KAF9879336.1 nitrogen assimilation transcription factor nira [Colletotrichum karsti]
MAHQVKLRPLLPHTSNRPNPPSDPAPLPKRKRPQVSAACNGCRKRKVKCDGVRPSCYSCSYSKIPCVYPVPEGLSQREAQKQKLSDVSKAHENSHRVLQLLRASQDGFSYEILQQLRQPGHLDDAIQAIADASLLFPQGDDHAPENADPGITLPLSRWTTVSHDDKLLTRLLDLFWAWDGTLSLLVDRELLAAELSTGVPGPGEKHRFCSPLLINAILAVSSLHSTRDYSASAGEALSLSQKFAEHAFDLIEAERDLGSLTLIQSAAILWVYARNEGSQISQARAARLADLMRQLWSALFDSLEQQTSRDSRLRQAISQISWGFYCFFA